MMELPVEYMNKLAEHTLVINALLAGFSLTMVVGLLGIKEEGKIYNHLFRASISATVLFLISIFAMTNLLMLTTKGFPFPLASSDFTFPRTLGVLSFMFGIIALLIAVGLSGWTKSRSLGWFTSISAMLALFLILSMIF